MPSQKKSTGVGKAAMSKKKATTRSSNRLTKADLQALGQLDRILEEERRTREKYRLPLGFRVPQQIATSLQQCTCCKKDVALLIFGDNAHDVAGLEAYARMMEEPTKRTNLPTYIIAPPTDPSSLDNPALLLKVWPSQEESHMITPPEWEVLIKQLSDEHCKMHKD